MSYEKELFAQADLRIVRGSTIERKQMSTNTNRILSKSEFSLIYAPLHPGFFGDAIYVKAEFLSTYEKFRSHTLNVAYLLLHMTIYPALGKPRG